MGTTWFQKQFAKSLFNWSLIAKQELNKSGTKSKEYLSL